MLFLPLVFILHDLVTPRALHPPRDQTPLFFSASYRRRPPAPHDQVPEDKGDQREKRGIWIDTRIPPVKDLLFRPVIFLTLVTPPPSALAGPLTSRHESRSRFNKLDSSNPTPIVHPSVGRFLVLDFGGLSHSAIGIRNLSAQQIFYVGNISRGRS